MDLKLPIQITDELESKVIRSTGLLNLASGEITDIQYIQYDVAAKGPPFELPDYEFSNAILSKNGREIEFTVQIDKSNGEYSVSPSELSELKVRAASLFAGAPASDMLRSMNGSKLSAS